MKCMILHNPAQWTLGTFMCSFCHSWFPFSPMYKFVKPQVVTRPPSDDLDDGDVLEFDNDSGALLCLFFAFIALHNLA